MIYDGILINSASLFCFLRDPNFVVVIASLCVEQIYTYTAQYNFSFKAI